ncbi:MAG: hypothetical protein IJC56_10680 [Clostridia bacterium]|nr:hypothetical protein [Clostridia bacterium]
MIKMVEMVAKYAGVAATAIFGLLLVWYLVRYFTEAEGKNLLCGKYAPRLHKPKTPIWQVLLWVAAAFIVSRGLMFLGGALAANAKGILETYLEHPDWYWTRWDGHHYIGLIENWYVNEGDPRLHIVFFPLYPAIGRIIHLTTGLSPTACAYLVSNLMFIGCGVVMFRLAEVTYGKGAGLKAMLLMNLSPLTLFCSTTYTESTFMLTTLCAVYFARRQKFGLALVFGMLSANSRMVGMATAIPIFFEMLRAKADMPRAKRYVLCVVSVLPVAFGLLAYLWLNYEVTGDPFRFMVYQSEHWSQNFGSLMNTLDYSIRNAVDFHVDSYKVGVWIPQVMAIFIALILFALVLRRVHPGDIGYSLVYFYCSVAPTWLLSGPRYLTAMYASYPLMAVLLRRKVTFVIFCTIMGILCMLGGAMFAIKGCIL